MASELEEYARAVESFSAADWVFERRELVLLSLDPDMLGVSGFALMERMHGSGGTAKLKMRLFDPLLFEPISADQLRPVFNLVPDKVSTAEHVRRIDPSVWPRIIAFIQSLRPAYAEDIDVLIAKREEDHRLLGEGDRIARLVEQRDALGLVLDIGGLDRKETLRTLHPARIPSAASVLDLLDQQPLHEQDVIRHDQQIFQDLLDDSARNARIVGKGGRSVRVHVFDRKPLETILGTDLLIYQEAYRSFLLIQYKNMVQDREQSGSAWWYRIDEQIYTQIEAMSRGRAAIDRMPWEEAGMVDWRLHPSPFYFKFCETTRPGAGDASLVRGIILQLDHLEHFLILDESDAGGGGRRIGYHNCPRYLNNTQFVDLAREGWIGCDERGFSLIRDLLNKSREAGRQAILALIEGDARVHAGERNWRNR